MSKYSFKWRRHNELFQKLPDGLKREVIDYIEFLLERKAKKKQGRLRLTWKGGLKEFKDKYSSVELQHKALEWW
ncbi:XRE family transcriptional regulator [Thermococci archaeon]|nr:MAG: XRE family transcriptional regulator [Thermococci archaeon]